VSIVRRHVSSESLKTLTPMWIVPLLRLPVLRVVDAAIEELVGARGHPHPERFREALQ
jgi:hypothetical protein